MLITLVSVLCLAAVGASRVALPTVRVPVLARPRAAVFLEAAKAEEEKEDRLGAGGRGGHAVKGQTELEGKEKEIQMKVMEHQKTAARLSNAEDARSLVSYSNGFGVISTNSVSLEGYPTGSVAGFAPDEKGMPVFCFSTMSAHTTDLLKDQNSPAGAKASLTVMAADFKGASEGRVTLIGDIKRVKDEAEVAELRKVYKQKHPNAFWVDFGDFLWFRMSELKAVRFIGGFARAGDIGATDYQAAQVDPTQATDDLPGMQVLNTAPLSLSPQVDPIQAFAAPVMSHMNDDHAASTVAMVQHYIGLDEVEKADLVALDRLGFNVAITRKGQTFKLRLPFPRPATDRKDVKALIVEMTQASAGAA